MTIVKSVQFRENLKELLEKLYKGDEEYIFLDYYGKLFKIVSVNSLDKNDAKLTKTQKIIDHFKKTPTKILSNSVFNELDASKEKENFRNLKYTQL